MLMFFLTIIWMVKDWTYHFRQRTNQSQNEVLPYKSEVDYCLLFVQDNAAFKFYDLGVT